jgi:hypothetical protein
MSTLIRFLEAARTVWRVVLLVVAGVAIFSFHQYKNNEPSLFGGDDVGTVVESVRTKTDFGFFAATFERIGRFFGREATDTPTRSVASTAAAPPDTKNRPPGQIRIATSRTAANVKTSTGSTEGVGPGTLSASVAPGSVTGPEDLEVEADTSDPRLAFRRFASQFCRATRAIAIYYSDRVSRPNGFAGIRVGSGVHFQSLDRLTDGPERSLAEKELEVRLRCDYELTFGAGERADPKRPAFEQWRQATLEHQYGALWTRIDLSHVPTPDDPMSRGEWYVLPETSQE